MNTAESLAGLSNSQHDDGFVNDVTLAIRSYFLCLGIK